MATYFLLAIPGERHEDCTPVGLYTLAGLRNYFQLKSESKFDSGDFYVFFMTPDETWDSLGDCDLVISCDVDEEEDTNQETELEEETEQAEKETERMKKKKMTAIPNTSSCFILTGNGVISMI